VLDPQPKEVLARRNGGGELEEVGEAVPPKLALLGGQPGQNGAVGAAHLDSAAGVARLDARLAHQVEP
jgi:hypothetical protein